MTLQLDTPWSTLHGEHSHGLNLSRSDKKKCVLTFPFANPFCSYRLKAYPVTSSRLSSATAYNFVIHEKPSNLLRIQRRIRDCLVEAPNGQREKCGLGIVT